MRCGRKIFFQNRPRRTLSRRLCSNMNISKILSEKLGRRVGELRLSNIVDEVVPALVAAEEEVVKAAFEKAEASTKFAVKEAQQAGQLLIAQALEKALSRAAKRVTAKRILRVFAESYRASSAHVTERKTDASVSGKGVKGGTPSSGGNRAAATS